MIARSPNMDPVPSLANTDYPSVQDHDEEGCQGRTGADREVAEGLREARRNLTETRLHYRRKRRDDAYDAKEDEA